MWLSFFDQQGTSLEEQALVDFSGVGGLVMVHKVAMARSLEGGHFLHMKLFSGPEVTLYFGPDGRPQEQLFFADSLAQLPPEARSAEGEVLFSTESPLNIPSAVLDNVAISAEGQVLFADDFEDGDLEGWEHQGNIQFVTAEGSEGSGLVFYSDSRLEKADPSWQDFYLEADVALMVERSQTSIRLGSLSSNSTFTLSLAPIDTLAPVESGNVGLNWSFRAPPGSGLQDQLRTFSASSTTIVSGLPYRLGLGFVDGRFRVSVAGVPIWSFTNTNYQGWSSLAFIEDARGPALALAIEDQGYSLSPGEEDPLEKRRLDGQVSEIRTWEGNGTTRKTLGICLPSRHQVVVREEESLITSSGVVRWPIGLGGISIGTTLGTGAGQGAGEMLYPLSFDAGPDGRIFVLDAGNGRIQVFDTEGKYLTQWGHKGSGEGEFDFGSGQLPEDFAGSVTVDGEGYIYVADVGNKRIQKFAP